MQLASTRVVCFSATKNLDLLSTHLPSPPVGLFCIKKLLKKVAILVQLTGRFRRKKASTFAASPTFRSGNLVAQWAVTYCGFDRVHMHGCGKRATCWEN